MSSEKNDIRLCIVNYGSGNVASVYNVFSELLSHVVISDNPTDINQATHIVLPGVGAFGAAMSKIEKLGLIKPLEENVLKKKKPFLGICVGMQILADTGFEYGEFKGLGWIAGAVRKLNSKGFRLPHIGWNNCQMMRTDSLFRDMTGEMDFYFVHSYHLKPRDPSCVIASCQYGEEFAAAVQKENVFGVQFHPEKSQKVGKRLLQNFLSIN